MHITVSIEPVVGQGFLARSGDPVPASVEAPTRDEALSRLRDLIERRLASGVEVVSLEITDRRRPSIDLVGDLRGAPPGLVEEWKAAMAEYRRQRDTEDEA
jgi:hypothetical protein